MAGLLDNIGGLFGTSMDDPRTMATLQMAQGLLGGGGSMQRLAGGMQGYGSVMAQARQQEEEKKRRALQEQMMMQQLEAAKAQQAERAAMQAERAAQQAAQQKDDGLMRRLLGQPVEQQMPQGMQGPGEPMQNRGIDPRTFINQGGSMGGLGQAMQLSQALSPAQRKLTNVAAGGTLFDENTGQAVFTAPKEDTPDPVSKLIAARDRFQPGSEQWRALNGAITKATTHAPGVNVTYGAPMAGVDAKGNPVFFQPDKGGGAPAIIPGVTPPKADKHLTEGEAKASLFQSQMIAAEKELSTTPIDQTKLWSQVDTKLAGGATNVVASPAGQRARQAQEQWAEAYLRLKTGAATTKDEVARNIATYFPTPFDSREVVVQKARQRVQAMNDVGISAGRGAQKVPAFPPKGGPTGGWEDLGGGFKIKKGP